MRPSSWICKIPSKNRFISSIGTSTVSYTHLIFAYVYDGPINISISGGTIEDNISTVADIGHAIGLYGYEGSIAYPRLELSGSPEIDGDIYYQNDYEDGYVIM